MKKTINIIKIIIGFIVAGIVIYAGHGFYAWFVNFNLIRSDYKGVDGNQSPFEKLFPNFAEVRDKLEINPQPTPLVSMYVDAVGWFSGWYVRTFGK